VNHEENLISNRRGNETIERGAGKTQRLSPI
jgi:hypothetical protein